MAWNALKSLKIPSRIAWCMAYDPDFTSDGFVYPSYTRNVWPKKGNQHHIFSRVSSFSDTDDTHKIDPDSETVMLTFEQHWNNLKEAISNSKPMASFTSVLTMVTLKFKDKKKSVKRVYLLELFNRSLPEITCMK